MRATDRLTFAGINLIGVIAAATVSVTFVPSFGDLLRTTPAGGAPRGSSQRRRCTARP